MKPFEAQGVRSVGPLDGLRIVDLTQYVAGPYCTRLLAEQGATIVRVERPGGDPIRKWRASGRRGPTPVGLLYTYLNHGKSTQELDLSETEGRDAFIELVREADVLVENFRPGTMDRFGLGWNELHSINPRLILTSISNFGQRGPYQGFRAWDIVIDALGGLAYIHGFVDGPPLTHGNPQAQYRAGVVAASATMAALLNRTDVGEHVDISIMECIAVILRDTIPQYTFSGAIRRRSRGRAGGPGSITPCSDGWVIPSAFGGEYSLFANFLGVAQLEDERFATGDGRQRHSEELGGILSDALKGWKSVEFFEGAQTWGLGVGIVLTPAQALESEQFASRGFFEAVDLEDGTRVLAPRGAVSL